MQYDSVYIFRCIHFDPVGDASAIFGGIATPLSAYTRTTLSLRLAQHHSRYWLRHSAKYSLSIQSVCGSSFTFAKGYVRGCSEKGSCT